MPAGLHLGPREGSSLTSPLSPRLSIITFMPGITYYQLLTVSYGNNGF